MAKQIFKNGASSTLAVSLVDSDVTVQVQSGYGALFPAPTGGDWFLITLEDVNANVEICKCTARSGDLMTVVRAQEGTSAQAFTNTTTRVELRNTKGTLERMVQRSGDTLTGDLDVGGFSLLNAVLPQATDIDPRAIFPVGMISLWSGSIATIPQYWALCNGSGGTPDLRDRFVVGAGSSYAVNGTGGALTDAITTSSDGDHDHGGTTDGTALTQAQLPVHNHSVIATQYSGDDGDPLSSSGSGFLGSANTALVTRTTNGSGTDLISGGGSGEEHTHPVTSGGAHTHTATVDTVPPYYALAYIMFTGV